MRHAEQPVLLFDLGGVLIRSEMFAELRRLLGDDRSEAQLIELWLRNPLTRRFELGQCSMEAFAESAVLELGLDLEPEEFLAAFKSWPKGFFDGAEGLLRDLRTRCTVCCLSNSNEAHWTDAIAPHFDHAFSSHLIGCIKPDRESFAYVVNRTGATPEAIHFFDDAPTNVNAARSYGLNAYHTDGFESLKARLRDLGFL